MHCCAGEQPLGFFRTAVKDSAVEDQQMLVLHQDHIADRGYNCLYHCGLVLSPIPKTKETKLPDAKATVDRESELEKRRRNSRSPS